MCSNDVGRKMKDGSIMSITEIKIVCIVQLSLTAYTVWQRQMMCSNEVGREI